MNGLLVALMVAATATPKVGPFAGVEISDGIEAQLSGGAQAVKLEGDEAVLKQVDVLVKGDVLEVKLKDGFRLDGKKVVATITAPVIDRVGGSGGSKISGVLPATKKCKVDGSGGAKLTLKLECESLSVDLSGGSQFDAQGTSPTIKVKASGGAQAGLGPVKATTVTADASGGARVHVHATAELKADLSGGAQLFVAGKPTARKVEASGGSRVIDE